MENMCETCRSPANFVMAIDKTSKGYQNAHQAVMVQMGMGIGQDRQWLDKKLISK